MESLVLDAEAGRRRFVIVLCVMVLGLCVMLFFFGSPRQSGVKQNLHWLPSSVMPAMRKSTQTRKENGKCLTKDAQKIRHPEKSKEVECLELISNKKRCASVMTDNRC